MNRDQLEKFARAVLAHDPDAVKGLSLEDFAAGVLEVLAAQPAPTPYHIPGPYEIALAVGAALASSGLYATPGAAMVAAWSAVPDFFDGRDFYLTELVPARYGQAPAERAPDDGTQFAN